ncbi:MAG: NAD(P)/FAD-dependent oxidoreductase [Candidatus Binatia bacterium]|nr:NAD(P)/FAD-dependent oxidoreductase [Candidatus Binatia bacterium]
MHARDVVIIGSGPAGSGTALHLLKREPALAGELLILEKARHPRERVCAGGLIPHTLHCLEELEIPLTVSHVRVDRAQVRVPPNRTVWCADGGMCRVVRRDAFDYMLVQAARARGAEVREGEKVLELVREGEGIRVVTEKDTYRARVVVGADGSGSRVRRQLVGDDPSAVAKALMCDIPLERTIWNGFQERRYDFNFLPVSHGLRGYLWAFPCLVEGVPHVNVGIYSLSNTCLTRAELQRLLRHELACLSGLVPARLPSLRFRGFPIYGYRPGRRLAAPHVVLVGDAAGAEPLMGEGISFALEYGKVAARTIQDALWRRRFEFAEYTETIAQSWFGKKLARLYFATRLFYGTTARLWFALAARSHRLQAIGLKWYNGVDGWHQRSGWAALRAVLFASCRG